MIRRKKKRMRLIVGNVISVAQSDARIVAEVMRNLMHRALAHFSMQTHELRNEKITRVARAASSTYCNDLSGTSRFFESLARYKSLSLSFFLSLIFRIY